MSATIRLLGSPRVTVDGDTFDLPPGKTSALLYYLAYKNEWVGRDELVYLFWPESDEGAARRNLRQLLTTLRRLPYTEQLETEASRLRWQLDSDASAFKRALADKNWLAATEAYNGELLQTVKPTDLPEFEEWLELERTSLRGEYRAAMFTLAGELEATNRHASAAELLEKVLRLDFSDEEALRRLLKALHHSGQRHKALETFATFQVTLERSLGGEPEEATLELVATIKNDTNTSAAPVTEKPNHNLPAQLTPFVGREATKRKLTEMLHNPGCRLLTLVGPGGIGKTRLALEVARARLEAGAFKDGVWFVNLAPVTDRDLLVSATANALDFSFYGAAEPKAQLFDHLKDKDLLLVLDNFEQLVSSAPLVADLLAVCPNIRALVTSREPLQLRGEREFSVPPLTLPDPHHLPSLTQLSQYEAVAVFIQRAVAVKANFEVTNENAPAVAEICHRLDGLPLATELAAARIKLFSPQTLLARLGNKLQLLTGGARDLPERQQTLRNTIAWSYDLLDADEQTLFARLSVFAGGRTLEAAEAVCNVAGDIPDVLEGVTSLVNKSLLRHEEQADGEPRFVMLETIHEYARERLEQSGEADPIKQRHAEFFVALAEEARMYLKGGPEQAAWLERLEAEHDNFRTALAWALQQSEVETGLKVAGALWQFWDMRGHFSEGRGWLERVLARSGLATSSIRAGALNGAGVLALVQGDYPSARTHFEGCLAICRELGDKLGTAAPLANLGHVACDQGDYLLARTCYEESSLIYRELGDGWGVASSLTNLGIVTGSQGNYASARTHFEESLAIYRGLGENLGIANSLTNLGIVALAQEDYASAYALYQEAFVIYQALGDKAHIALSLASLADVASRRGERSLASSLYRESLVIRHELGAKANIANLLEELAGLATYEVERSARLWGAAEVIREGIGAPLPLNDRPRYEHDVAATRFQLSEAAFAAAWAQGRAMTLEQAVAYALEFDTQPTDAQSPEAS